MPGALVLPYTRSIVATSEIRMGKTFATKAAYLTAFVLYAGAAHTAQDPAALQPLIAALDKARAEQVDVLAPTGFATASEALANARREAERGRNPDRVSARVGEGLTALQGANRAAVSARDLFGNLIKTREDAVTAESAKFAGEAWTKASARFNDAMVANERADLKNSQRRAAEAEVLLRDAELIAIKGGMLNEARALIAQADEAKVGKLAPRTLQAAKRHLADAEQEIQRNRYDLAGPKQLSARARYEARHAMYLAQVITAAQQQEDDDKAGFEALILSWEEPLQRLATDLEISASFEQGPQQPMRELSERSQQQRQELRRLTQEIEARDEQMAELTNDVRRLESRLGGVSEERVNLQRRVDAQERLRTSIASVEGSFSPDEARVYRQGEDVVVSLLGIKFAPGRSAIDDTNTPLMRKVTQALALFPAASISVEGHTDANGSDTANLILSQDRADAVKQFLIANAGVNAERTSSIGYGEARPVATNETADGRARNRRIDLVIHLTGP
jgi:OmpA-OmpF porin, OOP family